MRTITPSASQILELHYPPVRSLTHSPYHLRDDHRLRESTLRNVFFLVDKLEEPQLQDRLVRAITNLQNDPDSSIRTNATIFLGRIATRLKEPVRYLLL